MADLDLLRDINNTYGHLAGDAVLQGIAEVFRAQLRHYDVPARFGGEEFAILLPETPPEQAFEIAERIRRAVGRAHVRRRDLERADPGDRLDRRRRVPARRHRRQRADPPGRPRRLPRQAPGPQPRPRRELGAAARCPRSAQARLVAVPEEGEHVAPLPPAVEDRAPEPERRHPRPHALHGPRFLSLSRRLAAFVGVVSAIGIAAGIARARLRHAAPTGSASLAIVALVGVGQALALEVDDGSISVSAVGALAGAALFGPRAALALASRRRSSSGARAARRSTTCSSTSARSRSRRSRPPASSAGVDFGGDVERQSARTSSPACARRRDVLRRQHGPAQPRARDRGPRALVARLAGALRLAAAALPRLRLHRRRDRDRLRRRQPLGARRLRACRCC